MTHNQFIQLIKHDAMYHIAIAVIGDDSALRDLKTQLKQRVELQGISKTPFKRVYLSPTISLKGLRIDKISAGRFSLLFVYHAQKYGYINVYAVKRDW